MKNKGFTVIELILVVAIIAILATVILINVTTSISKGKDVAIVGNLISLIGRGTGYADEFSDYSNFCTSTSVAPIKKAIENEKVGGTWWCKDTDTKWCVCSEMKVNPSNTFCVDSAGYKRETGVECANRCKDGAVAGAGVCSDL